MKRRLLPTVLVLVPFILGGCGGDEGDGDVTGTEPTDDLALMQACAVEGLVGYGFILEDLWHVLKKTDNPSYTPPADVDIDWGTGAFTTEVSLGSLAPTYLEGTIEPVEDCADGMQQGDVCVFEWFVHIPSAEDTVAIGTYSAVDMGLTTPPDQTTAIRYTISRRNTAILASDECALGVHGFDWMLRPWDSDRPVTSAQVYFETITPHGTMDGSIIGGAADSLATVTLTFGTQSQECHVNMYNWSVDCP
ncbi:MAG: hypothetical protein PVI01_07315 [Gemmatimonadales bacterium]|jgi:hypothetical protein